VKTAPGQEDLIDVAADAYEGLRIQAEKFTPAELARVIELLLAAQNDMRWTTSPRLSLELALVRATMPETDPSAAGTLSRVERLERLANLEPGSFVPAAGAAPVGDPTPAEEPTVTPSATSEPPAGVEVSSETAPAARSSAGVEVRSEATTAPEAVPKEAPAPDVPHAADAGSVDVGMLRRSWQALLDHLSERGQPVLRALLVSATPASFDGETLELAFPPSFRNNLRQVNARVDKLQDAISDLFGIRPRIECVTREAHTGGTEPAAADYVEEEKEPTDEEALARLKDVLGATPTDDDEAEG
jgi:DNA polymerase III gamma/tau subunit